MIDRLRDSSLVKLLYCYLSLVFALLLTSRLFSLLLGSRLDQPFWSALYNLCAYGLALTLCIWVPHRYFKDWRTSREELGLTGLPTWTDLGLALVGFFVYILLSGALTSLFELLPWFDATQAQDVGFTAVYSLPDRFFTLLALVVIAPIAEEILMRGWLYGKLRARLPLVVALLLVSLLFAFLHGQWNVAVDVFALSVVVCSLREITGTIYAGTALHLLKNLLAFYLLYLAVFA